LYSTVIILAATVSLAAQQPAAPAQAAKPAAPPNPKLEQNKRDVTLEVDGQKEDLQRMNDMVFSFAEPGFQEFETSKYLTGILEKNGFKIERNLAGIPTAWMASWGSGKPVIALGSTSRHPQASQKPASPGTSRSSKVRPARRGHNSGCRCSSPRHRGEENHGAAAPAGTLKLWPGVAEGCSAQRITSAPARSKDVDICIFAHVGANMKSAWGRQQQRLGRSRVASRASAHAAGAPWQGRSAPI
jgi:aminobenzoyl-glutamate utilization protein B